MRVPETCAGIYAAAALPPACRRYQRPYSMIAAAHRNVAAPPFDRIDSVSEKARRRLAAAAARKAGVEALLITHLPDVRWLCGFTGSTAAVVLLANSAATPVLIPDGRYTA